MSNEVGLRKEKESSQSPSGVVAPAESGSTCHMQGKGWLNGGLTMAICCGAPLLLVGAVAFWGLSLGAIASGALSVVALLACPVGMFLMMRMMMKDKN
ncbi:MAG: hypothetical protein E6J74_34290 [Deltaproteobacteria bacterium]|nr:MAG: hypothetical protein E6J74_34290 [Deltaproteobacteria bacterium]